jgi:2-desacetyl-2-hydroxyethyl bacteriochlorophyllide A dehydrogenase
MIAGWDRTGFPAIPGHEWSGTVDAVGTNVDRKLIGRPCVAENVLSDGGEVGFEHPGGYGEYLVTEARNVYPLPGNLPFATATVIEPLAVCIRGLRRLGIEKRGSALVFGDGPIGLLLVTLLCQSGMGDVAAVGGRANRLALAREFGAGATFNYHDAGTDLVAGVTAALGKDFPNVIEASGSAAAMPACLDLAGRGGKVLMMGDYGPACAGFPWNRLLHRELALIGSNASAGAWAEAVALAASHALPLERLITRRFPAASCVEALEFARASRDAIKVVMEW